jgi:predicted small lipoprotein YifL
MSRHFLAALWVLLALAACGRKAPPLPPLREVPETTTDLQVFQEENQVVLQWSYPTLTRSGRPLGHLASVEVWKAPLAPGQEKTLEGPQGGQLKRQLLLGRGQLLARLSGPKLEAATRGSLLEFREEAREGALYAVRSRLDKRSVSDFSNVVLWQPQPPPAPPTGLQAEPSAEGIALTWVAPQGVRFRLERQEEGGPWQVLAEVGAPPFLDRTAQQGRRYGFRLRAVAGGVVGFPSEAVEVNYQDLYPPPAPAQLLCLPEEGKVRLQWEKASEAGVTYKVFRQQEGGPWVHLHERWESSSFVDENPPPGQLTYAVKAVDPAGNQSEAATCTARGGL